MSNRLNNYNNLDGDTDEKHFLCTRFYLQSTRCLAWCVWCTHIEKKITPEMLDIFEVGVRYQMYHGIGLIIVAWALSQWQHVLTTAAGWCFFAGIFIFSGSLYILSLTGVRWLGAITPIGGLAFIAGWGCLVIAVFQK